MGLLVPTRLGMLRSIMLSSLPALLLLVTETQGAPTDECCREKRVGDTFYTLFIDDSFSGGVPDRCLNDCIYSVTGTSEPKFCFARGELPVECEDNGYGSGYLHIQHRRHCGACRGNRSKG